MTLPTDSVFLDSFFSSVTKIYEKDLQKNFLGYWPGTSYLMDGYSHKRSGSYALQFPLEYGVTNSNTKFFDGTENINTDQVQTATAAIFQWRNVASSATISTTDELANSGKAEIFDLYKTRLDSAMRSTAYLINSEIYSDGTNFGGKTIVGLAAGVSTTPTANPASGAVGGVDAPTNVWWQNAAATSFGSWATSGVNGSTSDNWLTQWNNVTDGPAESPNLILSGQDVWERYNRTLTQNTRFVDPNNRMKGDFTFQTLEYMGRPWTWDRMCPAGRAYLLNTKYVHFFVEPNAFFKWTEPRVWPDQFAKTRLMMLRTALVYRARMYNDVIDGVAA